MTAITETAAPLQEGRLKVQTRFEIRSAAVLSFVLLVIGSLLAYFIDSGDGFAPRVATIDALAGLAVGAFFVDRLLTFIPAFSAAKDPATRTQDIDTLRWGWGALLGAAFVVVTGMGAVAALTATEEPIDGGLDRVIAVLAIAGGVKGLARFKDAVNPPKKKTSGGEISDEDKEAMEPPPTWSAYGIGWTALIIGAIVALIFSGDRHGLELISPDEVGDGTVALVARFGPILVAAVVVQQLIERSFGSSLPGGQDKKLLTAAASVVLGVIAARLMDLYLLHNIGFFGTSGGPGGLDQALAGSGGAERAVDVIVTGLVIAAGTAPIHDLSAMLKRAK